MAACYTESLEVIREAHISNWQGFLNDLEIADECVYLYKNPGGKPRVQMPVLFMYGSYNWQLHVRLDTTYVMKNGKSAFQISKGEVPREFGQLMSKCHSAVGQDVTKDVEEFFQVVRAMFGWSSRTCPPRPIELSRLSALAGSTCPTILATTVLTWLGALLPKNRACSTGDKRWGVEYSFLHQGLQFYLHGDIQQVAIVAWLMMATWVIHLFPDRTLVAHTKAGMRSASFTTGRSMLSNISWWLGTGAEWAEGTARTERTSLLLLVFRARICLMSCGCAQTGQRSPVEGHSTSTV